MSKKLDIYQISVPRMGYQRKGIKEQEEFRGFSCGHCCGNGWNWGYDDDGDNAHVTCPICHGSGVLKAIVTTEWVADEKE